MNESANQNVAPHQSTEEATSLKAVEPASQIETEHAYTQTAVLARETVLPLTQNVETMTSDIRLVVRESREQTRQARVMNASLKIIAFSTMMISLAILVGVVYLLKDILALVVISFLIAYIFSPIVDLIERRGINRTLVVIIMTLLILSSFAFLSTMAVRGIRGQITKFSEVRDVRNPLLFSLELENDLDRDKIPEGLRQQFVADGATLSQNATISVEEAGEKWKLTDADNNRIYDVKKEESQLKIYKTLEHLVGTAATGLNRIPKFLRTPLLNYLEERGEAEDPAKAFEQMLLQDVQILDDSDMATPLAPTELLSSTADVVDRERVNALVKQAQNEISDFVIGKSQQIVNAISSSAKGAFSAFTTGIIILFLTFFLLNGGRQMKKAFIQIVPNRFFEPALVLIEELDQQLGDYLRSRLVQTIILAIVAAIGYWILLLDLRFAILLGIIAGMANLIPYIGPFIGAIPAIIAVFFLDSLFGIGWSLLAVVTLTLVIQVVDNAIITPLMIGKSVELGPVTTIVVVLLGDQLLGLVGLLMAVPITAMCKLIIEEVWTEFKGYSRSILVGH